MTITEQLQSEIQELKKQVELLRKEVDLINDFIPKVQGFMYPKQEDVQSFPNLENRNEFSN